MLVEVLWTNPSKEEEWVTGELKGLQHPSGRTEVLWVPLDPDKAEWTWACKWENLRLEGTRLVPPENQLSEPYDGQLELFPLWGTQE